MVEESDKELIGIRVNLELVKKLIKISNLPENIPANYAVAIFLKELYDLKEQKEAGVKP